MDPLTLALWAIRLAFLGALYVFLALVVRALLRDVRAAARDPAGALGRLVVIASASLPAAGTVFPLDAVTTLGTRPRAAASSWTIRSRRPGTRSSRSAGAAGTSRTWGARTGRS